MKILGIDRGTVVMGWGVIESDGDTIALVDCGAINVPGGAVIGERLAFLYRNLLDIIKRHRPDTAAVEAPFVAKNVKSAMAIGRAQAVALLAATESHLSISEYPPAKVKQMVASYGAGGKEQVQEMVRLHLGLAQAPRPADASDALAVAICHAQETRLENLIAGRERK